MEQRKDYISTRIKASFLPSPSLFSSLRFQMQQFVGILSLFLRLDLVFNMALCCYKPVLITKIQVLLLHVEE